jgi:hypothetical protein
MSREKDFGELLSRIEAKVSLSINVVDDMLLFLMI